MEMPEIEEKEITAERDHELPIPDILPVLPLKDVVVFPFIILPLSVSREKSITAVDAALAEQRIIMHVAQRDAQNETPRPEELYAVGTVAAIMRMLKLPDGRIRLLVQGLSRARVDSFLAEEPYLKAKITKLEEPVITATIITPSEFVGGILQLCQDKRGLQKSLEYLSSDRVLVIYELPFAEVVLDFYDKLKTLSRGYASLDYHVTGFWESPLVKLDILVNGDAVDALSLIIHRESAYERGKALVSKMRELIPRQMFEVAIQAAIGTRIIARESVKALRKNVLAKCYGGDISRKRKLLEKQKEGKKRMKRVGQVDIPQEAFLAVLKIGE